MKFYNQEQFLKNGMIQEVIWIEELGELQHEITKSLRGMLNKEHLIEELADVLICLEQLKIKYNISDEELQKWIDYKYNRNCKRQEQKEANSNKIIVFNIEEFENAARNLNRSLKRRIVINPKYDDSKGMFNKFNKGGHE